MELFQVIPDRLFGLLASSLKEVYAAILFRIYEQYQLTTFGMEREVIIDVIQDYLDSSIGQEQLLITIDEDILNQTDDTLRGRASALLRKLEGAGWVKTETWANYKQYVNLPDYAIKLLNTLDDICRQKQVEYQSFIYAAYTSVTAEEAVRQPHLALDRAYET